MPTIDEQLTELVAQKNSLAANLNTMGVTASESETLNTLVPKVLDIPTGGSSAVVQPLSVAQNGTYNPPSGVDGYAPVTVNVSGGGAVVQPLNVTQNGDYYPSSGTDGFDEVHVAVPSATLTTKNITQNGTYNASSDNADGYSSVVVNVSGGGGGGTKEFLYEFNESQGNVWINTNVSVSNIETLCFDDVRSGDVIKYVVIDVSDIAVYTGGADVYTMIFTQTRPMNVRIYNGNLYVSYNGTGPATNVTKVYKYSESAGGSSKGFEVYAADGLGGSRVNSGYFNNNYFSCFFDDNMHSTYTLNGVSATYSTIATGKQQILATTRDVTNQPVIPNNALIQKEGSVFTAYHLDSGSYVSVVGGWVGYPSGGAIYESAAVGTSNSVTLNSAHGSLLIFIGASSNTSGITTIDLNGVTYTIENIGNHFGAHGMYTAIEINGNTDTNITVTFPASCWSYVSVIGIDS